MADVKIVEVDWQQFMTACSQLASQLKGRSIYGVARGGIIVAGVLSYKGCTLSKELKKDVVVVDDVVDTGITLDAFFAGYTTAALWVRDTCPVKKLPTYCAQTINHNGYLLMPFEDKEKIKKGLKKNENGLDKNGHGLYDGL